jgi:hypothetical protein
MPTLINVKNNTGFIHIPRTSGSIFSSLLRLDNNYTTNILNFNALNIDIIHKYHYPSYILDRNIILTSIVRNPYDRFVSCYIKAYMIQKFQISNYNINNEIIPNITRLNEDINKNFLKLDDTFDIDNKPNDDFTIFFKTMTYFTYSEDKTTRYVENILRYEDLISNNYYKTNIKEPLNFYPPKFKLGKTAINFVNKLYDIDFKNFNYEKIIVI